MNDDVGRREIRRALISVYDKSGLGDLARGLHASGVEIVSTGSTARVIAAAGLPVTPVEEITGFPECLDGRVKTLHPKIHGGLLADVRKADHRSQLDSLDIAPFELVVVNLYPFTETVASGGVGGRVRRTDRYRWTHHGASISEELCERRGRGVAFAVRGPSECRHLGRFHAGPTSGVVGGSVLTHRHLRHRRCHLDGGGGRRRGPGLPRWRGASWMRRDVLRYGENPHQGAAVYEANPQQAGVATATQLHGKQMSYNNYVDADAALRAAFDFSEPAVAIIKHANPCGIAVAENGEEAYRKAFATDPVSAFGGVVAVNRAVSPALAEAMADVFTEVIIAPDFEPSALDVLQQKKNLRILRIAGPGSGEGTEGRIISGGMLVQSIDDVSAEGDDPSNWSLVAGNAGDADTRRDLHFAWTACRWVKSNAILLAHDGAAIGIGMGQVNRVDSARLAVERAAGRAKGSVAASDAFFPFADGLRVLIDAGVRAVVQPGGSVRDDEVFAAAREAGVTMYITGTRHFFH